MAKLNPFLRPIYLLIAKLKKLGEETFRETNSQKVTRISLFKKRHNFGRALCLHAKRKKGGVGKGGKKTWEKKKKPFFV